MFGKTEKPLGHSLRQRKKGGWFKLTAINGLQSAQAAARRGGKAGFFFLAMVLLSVVFEYSGYAHLPGDAVLSDGSSVDESMADVLLEGGIEVVLIAFLAYRTYTARGYISAFLLMALFIVSVISKLVVQASSQHPNFVFLVVSAMMFVPLLDGIYGCLACRRFRKADKDLEAATALENADVPVTQSVIER
jgi:hypothetical protein